MNTALKRLKNTHFLHHTRRVHRGFSLFDFAMLLPASAQSVFVHVALDSKDALLSDAELSCSLATAGWATCLGLH